MKISFRLKYFFVFFLLINCAVATAASLPEVKPSKIFRVTNSSGHKVSCTTKQSKKLAVVKKGKRYVLGNDLVKNMTSQIRQARGLSKNKLQKQLVSLKKQITSANRDCRGTAVSLTKLSRALTRADIAMLLDRAGFGLSAQEESLVQLGLSEGVEALVDEFMRQKDEDSDLMPRVLDRLDAALGATQTQTPSGQRQAILDLWLHTKNPYSEKLAMFLLSVWTVSGDVVEDETFRGSFWNYYQRLRDFAANATSLPDLGVQITTDPLMLIYLSNELNRRGIPNENYARELMELFTLGPSDVAGNPNYTESRLDGSGDIATAARMLTGWTVKKDYTINELVAKYDTALHAPGPHTMFADTSAEFTGDTAEDLVRGIFLHHPGVKNYYAREILKEYVTPTPSRELVESFGAVIKANDFQLRPALRVLFMSEAFYQKDYRDTIPLNPYDMAARTARMLGLVNAVNISEVEHQTFRIGMSPNSPPSVFWYPQDAWNSSSAILEKANLIAQLFNDRTSQNAAGWSPATILPQGVISNDALIAVAASRLNLDALSEGQRSTLLVYLSHRREYNGSYVDFTYDNTNPDHQRNKGLGIYYLLLLLPGFQLL